MTADFVHRNAAWERNTSLEFLRFLVTERFGEFLLNEVVDFLANIINICAFDTFFDGEC